MSTAPTHPPSGTLRLFPDPGEVDLGGLEHRDFVIHRLLEEGDSADLAWLVGAVGEARLRGWLARRGARQLSRRSRWFWQLLIGPSDPATEPQPGAPLWPL